MSIAGVSNIASPSSKMQSISSSNPSTVLPNEDVPPGVSSEPTQVKLFLLSRLFSARADKKFRRCALVTYYSFKIIKLTGLCNAFTSNALCQTIQ